MSRILIIEDEKNLSRFVELELQHEGYETEVCKNGRQGLELALDEDWDAILLDLMLPELNGLEVCRRVRQQHAQQPRHRRPLRIWPAPERGRPSWAKPKRQQGPAPKRQESFSLELGSYVE